MRPVVEIPKRAKEDIKPKDIEYIPSDDEAIASSSDEDEFEEDLEDESPPPKKRKLIIADIKAKSRSKTTCKKSSDPSSRVRPLISSSNGRRQAADQSDLPPISSIPAMFDDMVSHAPDLEKVVDRLNGRKLRVATMCSGTESPLLALRMITRSLFKQTGKKLEIEHIFSCEIEPFKQAYIERNFAPPILFRDVLELCNDYAYSLPSKMLIKSHCLRRKSTRSRERGHPHRRDLLRRLLGTEPQQENHRSKR